MNDHATAATDGELTFITNLTSWSVQGSKMTKLELLKLYQQSIFNRKKWGDINVVDVVRHVVTLIERETVLR